MLDVTQLEKGGLESAMSTTRSLTWAQLDIQAYSFSLRRVLASAGQLVSQEEGSLQKAMG